MRKFALLLFSAFSALLLAACGTPTSTALFKPDTPAAVKQADLDQCKIASFKSVPQAISTAYAGGYYDPGIVECSRSRRGRDIYCNRFGGYYTPPVAYAEDVNAPLRWRYVSACLRKKGYYILYNKPACASAADRARAINAKTPADLVCNPDANLDY